MLQCMRHERREETSNPRAGCWSITGRQLITTVISTNSQARDINLGVLSCYLQSRILLPIRTQYHVAVVLLLATASVVFV